MLNTIVTETETVVNCVIESVYRKRNGQCEAAVYASGRFQRVDITSAQYSTIAQRLSRHEASSGPNFVKFNPFTQKS